MKKILNGEKVKTQDLILEKSDGTKFYGSIHAGLFQRDGKIRGIRGIVTDINDRRIIEEKLKELLDHAPIGIMEIDLNDMNFTYINQNLIDNLGYTLSALNNKPLLLSNLDLSDETNIEFKIYDTNNKLKMLSGTKEFIFNEKGTLDRLRIWILEIHESFETQSKSIMS